MRSTKSLEIDTGAPPSTRTELQKWVHDRVRLPADDEQALLAAIDNVLVRHERLWQQSKQEAIQAVSAGFADRLNRLRDELSARDATVSSIARYFEDLVADLTERAHRDPKTRLMNFGRFVEQVEAFLALEQRGRWCAIGVADIHAFKAYNDTLGHATGDRIIDRVARLLREQVRSDDLIAQEAGDMRTSQDLHARFGGDEFCFLISDLYDCDTARVIAERFREAVARHDWGLEHPRLADNPVRVDVGIICLMLSDVSERRPIASRLAQELLELADKLMYEAKSGRTSRIRSLSARLEGGTLVELPPDRQPGQTPQTARCATLTASIERPTDTDRHD